MMAVYPQDRRVGFSELGRLQVDCKLAAFSTRARGKIQQVCITTVGWTPLLPCMQNVKEHVDAHAVLASARSTAAKRTLLSNSVVRSYAILLNIRIEHQAMERAMV